MSSVYDSLSHWAKKTSTSFAALRLGGEREEAAPEPQPALIYRLKHWPDLPSHCRTANIYRTLSQMSCRPVNRRWFLASCKLGPAQADSLIQTLIAEDAIEVSDPSQFTSALLH